MMLLRIRWYQSPIDAVHLRHLRTATARRQLKHREMRSTARPGRWARSRSGRHEGDGKMVESALIGLQILQILQVSFLSYV